MTRSTLFPVNKKSVELGAGPACDGKVQPMLWSAFNISARENEHTAKEQSVQKKQNYTSLSRVDDKSYVVLIERLLKM